MTTVEDQQKFIVPMNEFTETLTYNLRMIIDSDLPHSSVEYYRAWNVSKVNRISPRGILTTTLAQDKANQHSDYIEKDSDGKIIGKWADYFATKIEPESVNGNSPLLITATSKITYSGPTSQIRVGGTKTFTVTFYEDDQKLDHRAGAWSFAVDDKDASEILSISYPAENKARVKFTGGDGYIGSILTVKYTAGDVESTCSVEIIAL